MVINTVLDTIKGLLTTGSIHVLIVPIAKTIPQAPQPALPPTLNDLQTALNVSLGPPNSAAATAYQTLIKNTGGNAGFYKAFATAIMNPTDPNRPQYDSPTDAVAMAVLLVGAPRYSSIISAASIFDQLTQPAGGDGAAARTVPIPQNVRAQVVGSAAAKGVGVQLNWDVPQSAYTSPYFPGVSNAIKRYALIRSTDPSAQSARSVLDFFQTQTLTQGMTVGKATVVSIGSGSTSAHLDTSTLDPSVPVYYCVAWETNSTEAGVTTTLSFDRISNITKVQPTAPQPPQTGSSPDWVATNSPINVFPPVAKAAQTLISQARSLAAPSETSSMRLSNAMNLATGATQRLAARETDLLTEVQQLSTALSRPIPSLYVTQMSNGSGGNSYLLSELAARLSNTTDPSRPPFDNGEYVCGICLVAGAPRLADLAPIIAFFDALFGPATAANPLLGLLASINTAVTAAETAVFGPNMLPLPTGTSTDPTVPGSIDPLTGKPYPPSLPVIAADGTPVAADSPDNPNAGFTNVTPPQETC
jgi:hypothetical protein